MGGSWETRGGRRRSEDGRRKTEFLPTPTMWCEWARARLNGNCLREHEGARRERLVPPSMVLRYPGRIGWNSLALAGNTGRDNEEWKHPIRKRGCSAEDGRNIEAIRNCERRLATWTFSFGFVFVFHRYCFITVRWPGKTYGKVFRKRKWRGRVADFLTSTCYGIAKRLRIC